MKGNSRNQGNLEMRARKHSKLKISDVNCVIFRQN